MELQGCLPWVMTLPATTAGERRGVHTSYALLGNRSALGSRRPGHRLGVVPVGPPLALSSELK